MGYVCVKIPRATSDYSAPCGVIAKKFNGTRMVCSLATMCKTADEVCESEKTFSQLNYEIGKAALGGTRTHTSRLTVDVLQLGSQSCIGGDEGLFRAWLPIEPAPVFSKEGATGIELACTPNRQSPCFVKAWTKWLLSRSRSVRFRLAPIVDWPHCLRETPAPFTSRSPDIATLGSSCNPNRQLSFVL